MNIPDTVLDLICLSYSFGDAPLFVRENGETISYADFVDQVFSISRKMLAVPNRYLGIASFDPVLYAEGYLAAIITGHIACLEQPREEPLIDSMPLNDKRIFGDEELRHFAKMNPLSVSELPTTKPEAPCTIAMSSGTASKYRRMTALSQTALLHDTAYSIKNYLYHSGQRCVHILPYWHMFGIISELFAPLFSGAVVCLPDSVFSFFRTMRLFCPHFLQMTPAIATQLATLINQCGYQYVTGGQLQKVLISGAPINVKICRDLDSYGIRVCTAYGLTECAPCVSIMPEWNIRMGTCGKPLGCLQVCIAEDSEILVRGSTVMTGYVSTDGIIDSNMTDGWFHTGDFGYLDSDGFLTVTGRKSSVLVFDNGEKCIPEEIEMKVNAIPNVVECLLGVRGENINQVPSLTVVYDVLIPDKTLIDEVMKQAGLPFYHYVFQREPLSKNDMGKLIRI